MPLYEYILRHPDRPDETLLSERDTVATGETLTIRNRVWIVVAVEPSPQPNVAERKILTPLPPTTTDSTGWPLARSPE